MSENVQEVTQKTSQFAHIYKNRWRMAITTSVIINVALMSGMVWSFLQKPEFVPDKTPITISVVGDAGPSAGPAVAAPQKSTVQPPAPLTEEQIADIKNGVPVEQVIKKDTPQTPTAPVAQAATGSYTGEAAGTGGGSGSEAGEGTGSGGGSGQGGVAGGEGTEPAGDIVIDAEYLGPRSLPGKGNVVVYVLINEAGRAVDVDIISSSGNGSLDRWALQQARSSAYRPKTVNGEPVVSEGKIEFGS